MTSTEALNITGSINTDLVSERKARLRDTQISFCLSSSFCRIPTPSYTKLPRNLAEIYRLCLAKLERIPKRSFHRARDARCWHGVHRGGKICKLKLPSTRRICQSHFASSSSRAEIGTAAHTLQTSVTDNRKYLARVRGGFEI